MATGAITATVNPDGWSASLSIEGFTTGATYNFGLTGNNIPSASTPYFTVVSLGYDNTGAPTTVTRTVYCTSVVRYPYSSVSIAGSFTSGTFSNGETITQGTSGATAVIVGPAGQSSGTKLYARTVAGTPDSNPAHTWVGGTSGAIFAPSATPVTLTQPTNNEKAGTAAMVVNVALSDFIYSKDNTGGGNSGTAPTFTAPAAFVVNTGGSAQNSLVSTAAAVTQSSTATYPKVVANWTWPGYQRVTGNFPLRCAAFHGTSVFNGASQASAGQMNIACVKFTAADTHSHTATTTVTAPTYDSSMTDAVPLVEWVGTMDVSTLTALDVLTCNFIAYPLVGDSNSILDTSAGTAAPTPLYGPIKQLNDKSNTYGVTVAAVDPINGHDSGGSIGVAVDIGSYVAGSTLAFQTIAKAAGAIAAYNNANHARNDSGGGVIYLRTGTSPWVGNSAAYGTTPNCWLTITPDAGVAQSAAVIGNYTAGDANLNNRIKLTGLTVTTTGNIHNADAVIWYDQNVINSSAGALFIGASTAIYFTRCTVNTLNQGLNPNGVTATAFALIRGNTILTVADFIAFDYTFLGNLKTGNNSGTTFKLQSYYAGMTVPTADNTICAFNRLYGLNVASASVITTNPTVTAGMAVVQNVFENYKNTSGPLLQLGADSSDGTTDPVNNVILWHNTYAGQRQNLAYNDSGSNAPKRLYWSVKNNIEYDDNIKTDTFAPANGARTGNWSQVYCANWSGNLLGDSGNGYTHDFTGLGTIYYDWSASTFSAYIAVTNYAGAVVGSADGAGGGTYTLTSSSPAINLQRDYVMPYDLLGLSRSATDAAGAYHYGNPSNPATWRQSGANVLSGNLIGQAGVFGVLV